MKNTRPILAIITILAFSACERSTPATKQISLESAVERLRLNPATMPTKIVEETILPGYETSVEHRTFYFGARIGNAYRFPDQESAAKAPQTGNIRLDEFLVDRDLKEVIEAIKAMKSKDVHS